MLQMTSDAMRELARHVTDILVERAEGLPGERAWEGDFKDAPAHRATSDTSGRSRKTAGDRVGAYWSVRLAQRVITSRAVAID